MSKPIRINSGDDSVVKLFSVPLSKGKWVVEYKIGFSVGDELTCINRGLVLESVDGVVKNEKLAITRTCLRKNIGFYYGRFEVEGGLVGINCKYSVEVGGIDFDDCWYKIYQIV